MKIKAFLLALAALFVVSAAVIAPTQTAFAEDEFDDDEFYAEDFDDDFDDDDFDETLRALQNIHISTGAKFSDTLNAYLREGRDVEMAIHYLVTYCGYEQKDAPEENSENVETVNSNDNHISVEAIKAVRKATSEELMYCKRMLQKYDWDVDKAIEEINNHPPRRPLMGRVVKDDEKDGK